jgi:putative transposase
MAGSSVRDIEDAFKDETGRLLLLKTAVSQLGERLWEDYRAFTQRNWASTRSLYLFVEGIAERLRPGANASRFWRPRVLPLRAVIKAIEICFPRAARQRCLAHRMRNLAAKVPEDVWPDFKVRAQAAYQAEPGHRARTRGRRRCRLQPQKRQRGRMLHGWLRSLHRPPRFPVTHRRAIRTTNLLERLFVEERRRLKIIPNAFGERAVLKLMFGALIRAAERWRSIKVTEFEHRQITSVRKELD